MTVHVYPGGASLESAETGGLYEHSQDGNNIGVELYQCESSYLAVFPDEASLIAGARKLVDAWGDELPVGIYRALTGPPGPMQQHD